MFVINLNIFEIFTNNQPSVKNFINFIKNIFRTEVRLIETVLKKEDIAFIINKNCFESGISSVFVETKKICLLCFLLFFFIMVLQYQLFFNLILYYVFVCIQKIIFFVFMSLLKFFSLFDFIKMCLTWWNFFFNIISVKILDFVIFCGSEFFSNPLLILYEQIDKFWNFKWVTWFWINYYYYFFTAPIWTDRNFWTYMIENFDFWPRDLRNIILCIILYICFSILFLFVDGLCFFFFFDFYLYLRQIRGTLLLISFVKNLFLNFFYILVFLFYNFFARVQVTIPAWWDTSKNAFAKLFLSITKKEIYQFHYAGFRNISVSELPIIKNYLIFYKHFFGNSIHMRTFEKIKSVEGNWEYSLSEKLFYLMHQFLYDWRIVKRKPSRKELTLTHTYKLKQTHHIKTLKEIRIPFFRKLKIYHTNSKKESINYDLASYFINDTNKTNSYSRIKMFIIKILISLNNIVNFNSYNIKIFNFNFRTLNLFFIFRRK